MRCCGGPRGQSKTRPTEVDISLSEVKTLELEPYMHTRDVTGEGPIFFLVGKSISTKANDV